MVKEHLQLGQYQRVLHQLEMHTLILLPHRTRPLMKIQINFLMLILMNITAKRIIQLNHQVLSQPQTVLYLSMILKPEKLSPFLQICRVIQTILIEKMMFHLLQETQKSKPKLMLHNQKKSCNKMLLRHRPPQPKLQGNKTNTGG